jgi:hypothetical protein
MMRHEVSSAPAASAAPPATNQSDNQQIDDGFNPPVNAFWSLTIYNATDKLLVDNPIDRYKIGTGTKGMVVAPDGSITIIVFR